MHPADVVLLLVIGVAWPLYDRFVEWPAFLRRARTDAPAARRTLYRRTIILEWAVAAVLLYAWRSAQRPFGAMLLSPPTGWRWWISAGAIGALGLLYLRQLPAVARSARLSQVVRAKMEALHYRDLLPRTRGDLRWFAAVSLTAGICEELIIRGYLIHALAPLTGWWGAAAVAVPVFGLLHAYQGKAGIVRTAAVGAVLTLLVAATRSLLPAMAIHTMIDIGSGTLAWLVLGERSVPPAESPGHAIPGEAVVVEAAGASSGSA